MKKILVWMILFALLATTACGQAAPAAQTSPAEETSPAAQTQQEEEAAQVQIPNPWREITEDEARALCPGSLRAPEGAENLRWSVMESAGAPALVQLSFDLNGLSYTAREQTTNDRAADISGIYYDWTAQLDITLRNWEESAQSGTYSRFIGEGEWADLCAWYDAARGISYTLSVSSRDLDGFDLQAVAEEMGASRAPARQDGERFEAIITIEGMEETVAYEHLVNKALGFEMDYDYERFLRRSEADRECFLSIYDDPEKPEDYLELRFVAADADTAAAAVREELSPAYELLENPRELEGAGSCLYIEASVLKGTNLMADHLQLVYIIPTADGCIVATEHLTIEACEGFGKRFNAMLNTLAVAGSPIVCRLAGTWQTASVSTAADGTMAPEYCVQFTGSEIVYGHMKDGAFVPDHADRIVRLEENAAGGILIQAEASNGVQYSYQTSESDGNVLEYYETWQEEAFSETYRGGASLSRCG